MSTILCNSIAMGMLASNIAHTVQMTPINESQAYEYLKEGFVQAVGHPATASILSERLGLVVEANRMNVRLEPGDHLIIAQVVVPRLEEGQVLTHEQVVSLPIQWWSIKEEQQ